MLAPRITVSLVSGFFLCLKSQIMPLTGGGERERRLKECLRDGGAGMPSGLLASATLTGGNHLNAPNPCRLSLSLSLFTPRAPFKAAWSSNNMSRLGRRPRRSRLSTPSCRSPVELRKSSFYGSQLLCSPLSLSSHSTRMHLDHAHSYLRLTCLHCWIRTTGSILLLQRQYRRLSCDPSFWFRVRISRQDRSQISFFSSKLNLEPAFSLTRHQNCRRSRSLRVVSRAFEFFHEC